MAKTLIVLAAVCTAYLAAATDYNCSDVTIRFYTGNTTEEFADYPIATGEEVLQNSCWNSSKETVMMFHGPDESVNSTSVLTIAAAYLNCSDHNVISVNFTCQSNPESWSTEHLLDMVNNTNAVGAATGEMINRMVLEGFNHSTMHLVGYLNGAHVAGKAARTVNGTIKLLVALDPLRWGYYENNNTEHLQRTDCSVVMVMHGNGYIVSKESPCGTVDFYPNSGYAIQPGCWTPYSIWTALCSSRAIYDFYAVSVCNSTAFSAISCTSWTQFEARECTGATDYMGFGYTKNASGHMFLQTVEDYPYSKGASGIIWSGLEVVSWISSWLASSGWSSFWTSSCC